MVAMNMKRSMSWILVEFSDIFLNYLEGRVSNPWLKIKYKLQLLMLIRENSTFITIIPCVIWNMLHFPSTPH